MARSPATCGGPGHPSVHSSGPSPASSSLVRLNTCLGSQGRPERRSPTPRCTPTSAYRRSCAITSVSVPTTASCPGEVDPLALHQPLIVLQTAVTGEDQFRLGQCRLPGRHTRQRPAPQRLAVPVGRRRRRLPDTGDDVVLQGAQTGQPGHHPVGEFTGGSDHQRRQRPDHDRDPGRSGDDKPAVDPVVRPAEGDLPIGQQRDEHRQVLAHVLSRAVVRQAEQIRRSPADATPRRRASTGRRTIAGWLPPAGQAPSDAADSWARSRRRGR